MPDRVRHDAVGPLTCRSHRKLMPMFQFSINLKVAEKDVNPRQHVSYDRYLVFFQEARIAYLEKFGYDFDGAGSIGLIATEAHCAYKRELRLGDVIAVGCSVRDIQPKSFIMDFLITRNDQICAEGSATLLHFDYGHRKVIPFPDQFVETIKSYETL